MGAIIRNSGIRKDSKLDRTSILNSNVPVGLYTAIVTSNEDATYTGRIKVRIPEFGSTKDNPTEHIILLMIPMGGVTSNVDTSKDVSDENTTVKTFGIWPQPPAIGTTVMVQFDPTMEQGICLGSLITSSANHNMGGNASGDSKDGTIQPVVEQNPHDYEEDLTKPVDTDRQKILKDQGLDKDYARGHSLSSARRESPSKVFGITTTDGHVLTMDDGDVDGNSKNIRLKTSGGATVLLDDTNGMIFVTNGSGNVHIELSADGHMDIYTKDSFSVGSEQDINFHAKGDINLHAGQGINIKAGNGIKAEALAGSVDIHSKLDYNVTAGGSGNVLITGNYTEQAAEIHMNGPAPSPATKPTENGLVENEDIKNSVASRVPERHPWKGATTIQENMKTSKGKT